MRQPTHRISDLTSAETVYVFRHAVMRDAAYQLQPLTQRALLHRASADLIEQAFGPGDEKLAPVAHELADHLALAIEGLPAEAATLGVRELRFLRVAALHAQKQADFPAAETLWRRCLGRNQDADTELETRLNLSGALHELGRGRQSDEVLQSALELEPAAIGPALRARVLLHAAIQLGPTHAGSLPRALELARAASDPLLAANILHRMAGPDDPPEAALARLDEAALAFAAANDLAGQARVLASRARILAFAKKQPDAASQLLRQAAETARRSGDRVAAADMAIALGVHFANFGQAAAAEVAYRDALELVAGTGAHFLVMRAQVNLGTIYLFMLDRVRDAGEIWTRALELMREHGRDTDVVTGLNNVGRWLCGVGRYAEAEPLLRECLTWCESPHWPAARQYDWVTARAYLAIALSELGRLEEALPVIEDAAARITDWNHQNAWLLGREHAWLLFRLARFDEARAVLDAALAHMRKGYNYDNGFIAAGLQSSMLLLTGDPAGARAAIEPWQKMTGRWRTTAWLLPGLRLMAASDSRDAGRTATAAEMLREIEEVAARGDSMQLVATQRAAETAQRLAADFASPQPRTWRGHFADELPPACRRALLGKLSPREAESFRTARPRAWRDWIA